MKASDLRELTAEELEQTHSDLSRQLFDLRIKSTTGDGTEQPTRMRGIRRDLARVNTVMTERKAGSRSVAGAGEDVPAADAPTQES